MRFLMIAIGPPVAVGANRVLFGGTTFIVISPLGQAE